MTDQEISEFEITKARTRIHEIYIKYNGGPAIEMSEADKRELDLLLRKISDYTETLRRHQ